MGYQVIIHYRIIYVTINTNKAFGLVMVNNYQHDLLVTKYICITSINFIIANKISNYISNLAHIAVYKSHPGFIFKTRLLFFFLALSARGGVSKHNK